MAVVERKRPVKFDRVCKTSMSKNYVPIKAKTGGELSHDSFVIKTAGHDSVKSKPLVPLLTLQPGGSGDERLVLKAREDPKPLVCKMFNPRLSQAEIS